MSEHLAYIVKINELKPHPNADRLQIATVFSEDVIVGLDAAIGDKLIYFPIDLALSEDYCSYNNLVRKKDESGNNIGGYLDPDKRNIKAVRLRGYPSCGLLMPLESLTYTGVDINTLEVGFSFDTINGKRICEKYIPKCKIEEPRDSKPRQRKMKIPDLVMAPQFKEHVDTQQLMFYKDIFSVGDEIEITLKAHGTSGRTAYTPKLQKRNFLQKLLGFPEYKYEYMSGTRRTLLTSFKGGWYHGDAFREQCENVFKDKLHKGETVYYEIVGYTTSGVPLMGRGKVPKEYQTEYGKTMTFSYGCKEGEHDIYVYRMTLTSEDGYSIEYTPEQIQKRCDEMGVKKVPTLWRGVIPDINNNEPANAGDFVIQIAEKYYDGSDPIDPSHVREGVVVRKLNSVGFKAYKHKNFLFKYITGIIKESAEIEQADETLVEEL